MSQKNVNKPNEFPLFDLNPISGFFPLFMPTFIGEDRIYLKPSVVRAHSAEKLIEAAGNYLQINNKPIDQKVTELRTGAIEDLQLIAQSISTPESCTHYITGLKMLYAINSGTFTLYYRPVKLCRTSVTYGGGGYKYGNYDLHENTNSYYYYDGNDFKEETDPVKITLMKTHIAAYQNAANGIQIRHLAVAATPLEPFQAGDVNAVTFSFQEIFALMGPNSTTKTIRVWNVAEGDEYPDSTYMVHTLLLSTEHINSVNGDVIFVNGFNNDLANLSHLCPPSCNQYFQYRLFKR